MRRVIFLGLLLTAIGMMSHETATAQVLKTEPKEEPKFEWPKEILGKNLELWVRTVKESQDASTRDQALRTLPMFGPDSRKLASANLINAFTKDPDINVRLTAIAMVPIIGFDEQYVDAGLNGLIAILKPGSGHANHTRYEVTMAIANSGPIAKRAIQTLADFTLRDPTSWQNRKAAALALGRIGAENQPGNGPDLAAVAALVKSLSPQIETSHQVRREVVNSLMLLGPPVVEANWKALRLGLTGSFKDTDKSIALWARVVYLRTEQDPIKAADPNLVAIAAQLSNKEPSLRNEAVQAIGVLGEEGKSRLSELIAIAQNNSEETYIIATAVWAMGQMPSEAGKIIPIIDPMKRHVDEMVKAAAGNSYKMLTLKDAKNEPPPKK